MQQWSTVIVKHKLGRGGAIPVATVVNDSVTMSQTRKRTRSQTRTAAAATSTASEIDPETTTRWLQHNSSHSATAEETDEDRDTEADDEDEEVVLSEQFAGPTDAAGKPHGRGTLTVHFQRGKHRGRNVFTGSFTHGVRSAHSCTATSHFFHRLRRSACQLVLC